MFCADINSSVEGPTPFFLNLLAMIPFLTSVENEDRAKGSSFHHSGSILMSIISNNNNPRLNTLNCFAAQSLINLVCRSIRTMLPSMV